MKKKIFVLCITLIISLSAIAQPRTSTTVSGNITSDETWSADTVLVEGEVTVDDGVTLTIDPGVYVEFQGHYKLNVQGRLLAIGTVLDSILFTINDTTGY